VPAAAPAVAIRWPPLVRRRAAGRRSGSIVEPREDLLALDAALTQLAATDPAAALVQLRYFGGLTIAEAAPVLRISPRTANRLWTYARAWLHRHIQAALGDDQPS
jgi:DNA-directed RNA polymerase specialized sigma24 family protein